MRLHRDEPRLSIRKSPLFRLLKTFFKALIQLLIGILGLAAVIGVLYICCEYPIAIFIIVGSLILGFMTWEHYIEDSRNG